ncbi:MAG: MOSC domain-containing protein [Ignavibacteria bacterium]|nr:MOSC domain-containing protein [Ignavibacteria bacterium]
MNREMKITAISISEKKGIPKSNVQQAELRTDYGIVGDAHAGNWHRQVSLLALESIECMIQKGLPNLRPGNFAENITTTGIDLIKLPIGAKLKLGNEALLEVTQIGKECHSRCAIYNTAGDCVMPREGIFARVIHAGVVCVNDQIEIIEG